MSSVQRVIKYCAVGLAVFFAVIIISSIVSIAFAVVKCVSGEGFSFGNWNENTVDFTETFTDVESLNIDNSTGELNIKIGNEFKVEAENVSESFKATVKNNGTLTVTEDDGLRFLWFSLDGFCSPNSKVTVYVPADFIAKETKIDTGAGNVYVENLQSEYLYISTGAGNINGSDLVAQDFYVDGGVGNVKLDNVNFTDAEFDCGVGNLNISGVLAGETKIDCGVGDIDLNLEDANVMNYGYDMDCGIGSIKINGDKVSGTYKQNNASDNLIKVDGGVGDVKINTGE